MAPAAADRDPLGGLLQWTWGIRLLLFVFIATVLLSGSGPLDVAIVELAIGAGAFSTWWLSSRLSPARAALVLPTSLIVLSMLGGFAATSHRETSALAFAIVAGLEAGLELPAFTLGALLLAGVLAVEIGAVAYGNTDLGTVIGYPMLLGGIAIAGRYRRTFRAQAEQAHALLAETERAQRESERAAALTERSRIAREIHDVLAHSLGALGIQLQAAEALLSERGDIDGAIGVLKRARRLADEGMTETRRAVHALRADAPPLPEALAALLGGDGGRLTVTGERVALRPAAGLALLRVAQEAVENARKHADGHPPTIALTYTDTAVDLRVENALDAARGETPADAAGGYGLAGMHERLRMIDGELTAGVEDERWVVHATVATR